jgi:LacI family gluconate utilization system Gnt-I transcriptional repressor
MIALSISLVPDEGCDISGAMGRKRARTGKIRLTEVAKLAGVSPITASRFFRNPEALSAGKRVRVESAANELGYVPNLAAPLPDQQRVFRRAARHL